MALDDRPRRGRHRPAALSTTNAASDQLRRTPEASPSSSSSSGRHCQLHHGLPRRSAPKPSLRRRSSSRKQSAAETFHRASSEPTLRAAGLLSPNESSSSPGGGRRIGAGVDDVGSSVGLPRHHTCFDVLRPASLRPQGFDEKAKVVVSVTVEGSPGPVKAMVRLGDSVEDAIAAVVDKYRKDGRTPRLHPDAAATEAFQLHHSHFTLQSLNKSDKIGGVGARSFYLRTGACSSSFHLGAEANDPGVASNADANFTTSTARVPPQHLFLNFVIASMNMIGRRARKLWRMLACMACL